MSRWPWSLRGGMGVKEPPLLVSSKKGFGHAGNVDGMLRLLAEKEFRNFFPFRCRPTPPKQRERERELSMTCAHGEPVHPELMHQAVVDVSSHMVAQLAV